jgi:hypothetical protein
MVVGAAPSRKRGSVPLRRAIDDLQAGFGDPSSIRALARRWKWSKNRANNHIKDMLRRGWIIQTPTGYVWNPSGVDETDFEWSVGWAERRWGGEKSRHIPKKTREAVMAESGGKCALCGSTEHLQVDHIRPFKRYGTHSKKNLRVLCRRCNSQKQDRLDSEWPRARAAHAT